MVLLHFHANFSAPICIFFFQTASSNPFLRVFPVFVFLVFHTQPLQSIFHTWASILIGLKRSFRDLLWTACFAYFLFKFVTVEWFISSMFTFECSFEISFVKMQDHLWHIGPSRILLQYLIFFLTVNFQL